VRREEPKGHLDLMSVLKVVWDHENPQSVVVRHMENKERFELVLQFSSEGIAKDWKATLMQIRTLLQRSTIKAPDGHCLPSRDG